MLLSTRDPEPEITPPPEPEPEPSRSPLAQINFRRRHSITVAQFSPAPPVQRMREKDRPVVPGQDLRLAVIIQMPSQIQPQSRSDDLDDETTGWEPGMELGLWEGYTGHTHR